ncbi:MAG: hypothetical protein KatS3mg111_2886 [Pirellulaceae bacterium]|nr:MAG: hypothetical protein KatS3mg111_2886 [Pirellulaceae bacterium]
MTLPSPGSRMERQRTIHFSPTFEPANEALREEEN